MRDDCRDAREHSGEERDATSVITDQLDVEKIDMQAAQRAGKRPGGAHLRQGALTESVV
ncbi:hypothetical protein CCAX7_001870 [Capsulimonas corticalis]|uniref:Uncharacterized protein n=1 Tax=Capsulimonas corticalis TaxID=2219043 RepID=A0A402CS11_9BACT|nr:hypothetical protein CCAX7_001870 [Capsulimonas corticalis]